MEKKNKIGFYLWDYLYYRTTLLYEKVKKKAGFFANKDTGAYVVTVVTMFNFFGLLLAIISLLMPKLYLDFTKSGYDSIVIVVILLVYSVIISMIMKKRHKVIFDRYIDETEKQKETRGAWLILYIMVSVIGFFISGYIAKIVFNQITG
jgi:hypothetical protein